MKPELRENLETILEQGALITGFVSDMDFESYARDAKTSLAVERCFEIIGEALNRASKQDPDMIDTIGCHRQIISFRNILAHCYDAIEDKIVWGIIQESLPQLLLQVGVLLK